MNFEQLPLDVILLYTTAAIFGIIGAWTVHAHSEVLKKTDITPTQLNLNNKVEEALSSLKNDVSAFHTEVSTLEAKVVVASVKVAETGNKVAKVRSGVFKDVESLLSGYGHLIILCVFLVLFLIALEYYLQLKLRMSDGTSFNKSYISAQSTLVKFFILIFHLLVAYWCMWLYAP